MLDLGMARIIAECMDKYYSGQGSEVSVATQKVAQDDPFRFSSRHDSVFSVGWLFQCQWRLYCRKKRR